MKHITDYLPGPLGPVRGVQAQIPEKLNEAVNKQMKKDAAAGIKVTWRVLFIAAARQYLEARGVKDVP